MRNCICNYSNKRYIIKSESIAILFNYGTVRNIEYSIKLLPIISSISSAYRLRDSHWSKCLLASHTWLNLLQTERL